MTTSDSIVRARLAATQERVEYLEQLVRELWGAQLRVGEVPDELLTRWREVAEGSLSAISDRHHAAPPWTPEEVDALVARQANKALHPYTCDQHTDAKLIPTEQGWMCPKVIDHAIVQTWAHLADLGRAQ